MFFDDARPQGYGGYGNGNTHGMVRQADRQAEGRRHVGYGPQVDFFGRRGIGRRAFQQGDASRAGRPGSAHRIVDLGQRGHAGGHDQRLAGARHASHQRQIHEFERGHFVGRNVHPFQKVDSRRIERRGETVDPQRIGDLLQTRLPLPRCSRFLVESYRVLPDQSVPSTTRKHSWSPSKVKVSAV